MKVPPPPPPIPSSGEPPAVKKHAVAQEAEKPGSLTAKPASPEDIEATMGFVNAVRKTRGWPPLVALPDAEGILANQRPLALALGVSVIKYGDHGRLFALIYKEEDTKALVEAGGVIGMKYPATFALDSPLIYEVNLPRYCYDLAS